MEIVFWASFSLLVYVLGGYPLMTLVAGCMKGPKVSALPTPSNVSVIVAAHNEAEVLRGKIEHLLGFSEDYDEFEIIVVSDGSTDETEDIVRSYARQGVRLVATSGWLGKTRALDEAVKVAFGDVLIFLDASGRLRPGSLEALVSRFADPSVGCVGGYVSYASAKEGRGAFRHFKRIDRLMKEGEGKLGFVPAVSGAIHGLRRCIYEPAPDTTTRDLVDAVQAAAKGYRTVYEPDAVLVEDAPAVTATHFGARVRMTVRGMTSAANAVPQLVRARNWLALGILGSHKLLRWWLWVPVLGMVAASFAMAPESSFFSALAIGQLAFLAMGALGLLLRDRLPRVLSAPSFMLLQIGGMLFGTWRWLLGEGQACWNPLA